MAGRPSVTLQSIQRNAHEWGMGDAEDVATLESRHPNEGKYRSPRGVKVLLL